MATQFGNNTTNNNELSSSSTAKTTSSRFSIFNRSLTAFHHNSNEKARSLERAGSLTKSYNPVESVKSIRGRVVQKLCNFFESPKQIENPDSKRAFPEESRFKPKPSKSIEEDGNYGDNSIRLPGTEDRIVVYFTSLRGIRRTFEDCYAVRMILRGFRVWVDERDISMDSSYRKELMSVMGEKVKNLSLPQVFIRGKYVGGVDVIKHLCEVGELGKILEGFPRTKPGFVCDSCGDVRFVPCGNCSGSRKVFDEDEGLMKRCIVCNENGLIRCPNCCS